MNDFFAFVLTASFTAAIAAVLVLLVKKLLGSKINVRISYLLWLVVLFRLVFPVLPASQLSIYNVLGFDPAEKLFSQSDPAQPVSVGEASSHAVDSKLSKDAAGNVKVDSSIITNQTTLGLPDELPYLGMSESQSADWHLWSFYLPSFWLFGFLVVLLYFITVNLAFYLQLRRFTPVTPSHEVVDSLKAAMKIRRRIRVVESASVTSPCVFGIFQCTVLLPAGLLESSDQNSLTHILAHEFAHIKRLDLPVCWLSYILCAVHWFNPVIWYSMRRVKQEQELCADAYVLSVLGEASAADYGQTLMSSVKSQLQHKPALLAAGINENKRTLMQRIRNVAAFSKQKNRLTVTGIALIAILAVLVCTSRLDYPKTGEERMKFDENVMIGLQSDNINNPQNVELQVFNKNSIAVHSGELEIYNGNPSMPGSSLVFSNKGFRVGGGKSKTFQIEGVDYSTAYIRFNYKVGLALDSMSNMTQQSGDLRGFDKTSQVNGWSAVSDQEISDFINQNKLNALKVTRIYGFYTIVIFRENNAAGYYELYKKDGNKDVISRRVIGYNTKTARAPVSRIGGTASGNYPFINFIIDDPILLTQGDKIELQAQTGTITTYLAGKAAHTVETKGYGSIGKLLVYDKNGVLIYDGEKLLVKSPNKKPDDRANLKVTDEQSYTITGQEPVTYDVHFSSGMFPSEYVVAYQSGDMDWKIPLYSFGNSTMYLKSIVQANESEDSLYATFYFIHDVDSKPGKLLSSIYVKKDEYGQKSYSSSVMAQKDVLYPDGNRVIKEVASLRSTGPGDQVAIYLKKSVVEETGGNFTVTLTGLNQISFVPK